MARISGTNDGVERTVKVLVACEESQEVCKAFRAKGHEAYSCDIIPCSGGHPEWHIQCDCLNILTGGVFVTMDDTIHEINRWDLIIAHPPCTYLTICGNSWFNVEKYGDKALQRYKDRYKAIVFFMQMIYADADMVAVENPIGIMNTAYRKPDQTIQPYMFGHPIGKSTCLWLKNLPPLLPTEWWIPERIHSSGKSGGYSGNSWYVKDENGKALRWADQKTKQARSKTFPGIAKAMADQWG